MSERTEEIIAHKCREHGCDPKDAKRHANLYLNEQWDVHPDREFIEWMHLRHPKMNPVTAWNTSCNPDKSYTLAFRNEWDQERNYGIDREPSHIPPRDEQLAKLAHLKQLIAKIGRPMPEPLPTDYDRGAIEKPEY